MFEFGAESECCLLSTRNGKRWIVLSGGFLQICGLGYALQCS